MLRARSLFRRRYTAANPRSGHRSQNRLHVQKALMEYLLLGKVES